MTDFLVMVAWSRRVSGRFTEALSRAVAIDMNRWDSNSTNRKGAVGERSTDCGHKALYPILGSQGEMLDLVRDAKCMVATNEKRSRGLGIGVSSRCPLHPMNGLENGWLSCEALIA
jgi:hypothetical protein